MHIASAVNPKDYPPSNKKEIAFIGRSNAGKSSLINAMLNKKAAYVSQQPGKTILLNFYDLGKHYRIVDMPGYGYAKRGKEEQKSWKTMIETYLQQRENLCGLVLVMDARRDWTEEEENIKRWCDHFAVDFLVAGNKVDQMKDTEKKKQYDALLKKSLCPVFLISAAKKQGVKELEKYLFTEWVKP